MLYKFVTYSFLLPKLIFLILLSLPLHLFSQMKINEVNIAPNNNTWVHIREISFSGNTISKSHIVLRDMSIQPGDSILATDLDFELNYNKKRILNLQLFSTVKYKVTTIHPDTIDVEFQVTELFYWLTKPLFSLADRNLNVWWFEQNHRLDRTNIGLEFTRINFRGRNEKIGAIVQGGYNKHFELFYSNPYIDKHLKHGFGINVLYATGREINYITDSNKLYFYRSEHYPYQRFQAKLAYTYRNAYAAIHEVNLSYHFFNISKPLFDLSPVFLGPRRRINYFELNYIFKYNNTDIRLYPINGIEMKTILSKKGLGIDKDVNQLSLYTESSFYRNVYNNISTSLVFRGRVSFPQAQPYYFNRAMGFKNEYVRGYEYYVIDGSHYALLRSNIRYKVLDFIWTQNFVKLIKHIPIKVYSKVYNDIGYVHNYNPMNSFLNNRFLNGYGAGVDILLSYYAKLRIEYSFNHLKQNSLFLHTTKE